MTQENFTPQAVPEFCDHAPSGASLRHRLMRLESPHGQNVIRSSRGVIVNVDELNAIAEAHGRKGRAPAQVAYEGREDVHSVLAPESADSGDQVEEEKKEVA